MPNPAWWLYDLGIGAYRLAIGAAALLGNPKARQWVQGRRTQRLPATARGCIWMHCASLGEFEQGRPLLEALRAHSPQVPVVLSFFSPSGYEPRKNWSGADHVLYLPLDTPSNARSWVQALQPRLLLLVRYELWLRHLQALRGAQVPTVLVAAHPTETSAWLRWPLRSLYAEALRGMQRVFTQDEAGARLLRQRLGLPQAEAAGDPRADRVLAVAQHPHLPQNERLARWRHGCPLLVAGSTWPPDEALLAQTLPLLPAHWKLLLVPHQLEPGHLQDVARRFAPFGLATWSQDPWPPEARVLLVDAMGLLSRLYAHGTAAWVGGGLGAGIHNTLEAAAHGLPVAFGPNYGKFREAHGLLQAGAALATSRPEDLARWLAAGPALEDAGRQARMYVQQQAGATQRVLQWVQSAGLL